MRFSMQADPKSMSLMSPVALQESTNGIRHPLRAYLLIQWNGAAMPRPQRGSVQYRIRRLYCTSRHSIPLEQHILRLEVAVYDPGLSEHDKGVQELLGEEAHELQGEAAELVLPNQLEAAKGKMASGPNSKEQIQWFVKEMAPVAAYSQDSPNAKQATHWESSSCMHSQIEGEELEDDAQVLAEHKVVDEPHNVVRVVGVVPFVQLPPRKRGSTSKQENTRKHWQRSTAGTSQMFQWTEHGALRLGEV